MNRNDLPRLALVAAAVSAVAFGVGQVGAAPVEAVIDFETGLTSGDIVAVLSTGAGIAGGDFGTVDVIGTRDDLPGTNQAMIFDATCGGAAVTCSGGDSDLFQPQLGNVLIISEDGDSSDPDDADVGEQFTFDFSNFGVGVVTVLSIDVLDVEVDETPGSIEIGGVVVPIPDIGDGNVQTLPINGTGDILVVALNGSGAIDNIRIQFEPTPPTTTTTTTVPDTTTTTTTTVPDTTTTTVPDTTTTTTTTVPDTTTTSTTTPTTTTTVPDTSTTTLPETTTTVAETTTTTTAPDGTTTTTDSVLIFPPTTTTTPETPTTVASSIPQTGAGSSMAISNLAAVLMVIGLGFTWAARRSPRDSD